MFPQNPGVLFLYNCMWICRNLKIKSLRNRYFQDSLHPYPLHSSSLFMTMRTRMAELVTTTCSVSQYPARTSLLLDMPSHHVPNVSVPCVLVLHTRLGLGIGWRSVPWPMSVAKHIGRKMRLPGWAWPVHRSHLGWVFSGWLRKGKPEALNTEALNTEALNTEARRGKGVAATARWQPAGKWGRPSYHHKEWTPAAAGMGLAETSLRRRPPPSPATLLREPAARRPLDRAPITACCCKLRTVRTRSQQNKANRTSWKTATPRNEKEAGRQMMFCDCWKLWSF